MRNHWNRRSFLRHGGASLAAAAIPARLLHAADGLRFASDPFSLGVASGYPGASSIVLWTRLAPEPALPGGGIAAHEAVPVLCEIASDERMRHIVRSERLFATADQAHSIHFQVDGLLPAREYWYRFTAAGYRSAVGRTRTAPAPVAHPGELRLAVASCQHYEQGYYTAYRHMLNDDLDVVLHVGDYIYETGAGPMPLRRHDRGETITLDDYRARHALYRSDADLQAAHAHCPWLVTWDDHEVENDYAGDNSARENARERFLARRAAAYQAYFEHMPLPPAAAMSGAGLRLYTQRAFGDLASLVVLDSRQYRSPLACTSPARRGAQSVNCPELQSPARSKLGMAQEQWLQQQLADSPATWNVLVQGTVMTNLREGAAGDRYWNDSWNGYRAARDRLMTTLVDTRAANPIVLSGDIHAFMVANVQRAGGEAHSPTVASEFVTTSISSRPRPQPLFDALRAGNPNLLFANSEQRGYVRLQLRADHARADLVAMDSVTSPAAGASVRASWVVEAGRPGPVPA